MKRPSIKRMVDAENVLLWLAETKDAEMRADVLAVSHFLMAMRSLAQFDHTGKEMQ